MALNLKRDRIQTALAYCRQNNLSFTSPVIFDRIYQFLIRNFPEYRTATLKEDARRVVELLRISYSKQQRSLI